VVLKVEPGFVDDFYYHLVPCTLFACSQVKAHISAVEGRHYIPVQNSLEDLEKKAQFTVDPANEHILKEIVYNANQWCSEHLLQDRLAHDQIELWEKYVKLLNKNDDGWQTAWLAKREALTRVESEYGMVVLN
jgi:Glycosyl transferase family 90